MSRKSWPENLGHSSPWKDLRGQILLGEEGFIEKYRDFISGKEKIREIPRSQRLLNRPQLAELFSNCGKTDGRNKLIYAAHVKHSYKMKEISAHLAIHYTAVSKAIKSVEEK